MSTSTAEKNDSHREQYLRRLHKKGYPPTDEKMTEFNTRFYDELGLEGEERRILAGVLSNFRIHNIMKSSIPMRMKRDTPELVKMFYEVAADGAKKWAKPSTRKRSHGRPKNTADDETSDANDTLTTADVDFEDIQEEEDEAESELDKLKAQLKERDCENMQLKNRNEELAETLKMKDDECHQLEERVRFLEETNNVLEKKNRSLEDAAHKKDQMMETILKTQETLHSLINKPTSP